MAAGSSRRPPLRTPAYWAVLEDLADDLIDVNVSRNQRPRSDARATLQKLVSYGYGPVSLFDLCALLILTITRVPATSPNAAVRTQPSTGMDAEPTGELTRGPVTVALHPTETHLQRVRQLEACVAEALLISSEHPRARNAVRRALMARGNTVKEATAVYGIVCELINCEPRAAF